MPSGNQRARILVKTRPGVSSATLALGADRVDVRLEPLFASIGREQAQGLTPVGVWHVVTAEAGFGEPNSWDICHSLLAKGFGIAGAPAPEFAEPDLQQSWPVADVSRQVMGLTSSCTDSAPEDTRFPGDPDPMWFHAIAFPKSTGATLAVRNGKRKAFSHITRRAGLLRLSMKEIL